MQGIHHRHDRYVEYDIVDLIQLRFTIKPACTLVDTMFLCIYITWNITDKNNHVNFIKNVIFLQNHLQKNHSLSSNSNSCLIAEIFETYVIICFIFLRFFARNFNDFRDTFKMLNIHGMSQD